MITTIENINDRNKTSNYINKGDTNNMIGQREYTALPVNKIVEQQYNTKITRDMFPSKLANGVFEIAEAKDLPLSYLSATVLATLAGMVGNRVKLELCHGQRIIPCLWAIVVGPEGTAKSPSMRSAMEPLNLISKKNIEKYEEDYKTYEVENNIFEKRKLKLEKVLFSKDFNSDEYNNIAKQFHDLESQKPAMPYKHNIKISEATREALISSMEKQNPNGIFYFRDEIDSLLGDLFGNDKKDLKNFFMTAFNGEDSYDYVTISRGTDSVENATLSILGSIQPGVIAKYIRRSDDSGLLSRFQLVVVETDEYLSNNRNKRRTCNRIMQEYTECFIKLAEIPSTYNVVDSKLIKTDSQIYTFTEAAQKIFNQWEDKIDKKKRDILLSTKLKGYLRKCNETVCSIALLFHLVDEDASNKKVDVKHLNMAIKWFDYLYEQIQQLHSLEIYYIEDLAKALLKREEGLRKIQSEKKFIDDRLIKIAGWSKLDNQHEIAEALALLHLQGYLVEVDVPGTRKKKYLLADNFH